MPGNTIRSAVFACCALVAGYTQAAQYQLTSHVTGVARYFSIYDFGFHDLEATGPATPFEITYRAVIDYAGTGSYSSPWRFPVDVTIALGGGAAQTSTILGSFSVYRTTFTSGPDAGKSYLQQYFSVYAATDSWDTGLAFNQTMELPGELASDPDSLPFSVPFTASSGILDYGIYAATDVGNMYFGGADGQVTGMSFTLVPVPEPTGWAMLGAGLLLTGAAARRRAGMRQAR